PRSPSPLRSASPRRRRRRRRPRRRRRRPRRRPRRRRPRRRRPRRRRPRRRSPRASRPASRPARSRPPRSNRTGAHALPCDAALRYFQRMPPPTRADTLLVTTIARHFPAATVIGTNLELGVAGLELGCRVGNLRSLGGTQETAQLVLELRGGRFPAPIPMTMTGYADTSDHAIVDGADAWAAAFGPVLRAALAGAEEPAVARLAFDNHGRGFRSYVDAFDRVLPFAVK